MALFETYCSLEQNLRIFSEKLYNYISVSSRKASGMPAALRFWGSVNSEKCSQQWPICTSQFSQMK